MFWEDASRILALAGASSVVSSHCSQIALRVAAGVHRLQAVHVFRNQLGEVSCALSHARYTTVRARYGDSIGYFVC